jgi:hypothetical protein
MFLEISKYFRTFVTMDSSVNSQNGGPKPIRWGYVVAIVIVIAIMVLAEIFHPRSSHNKIKAFDSQIEVTGEGTTIQHE